MTINEEKTVATKEQSSNSYETNPLKLAWYALRKFRSKAPTLFWITIVLSIFSGINTVQNLTANNTQSEEVSEAQLQAIASSLSTNEILAIGFIALVMTVTFLSIALIAWGVGGYTAARMAEGKSVSLREAFDASIDSFWRLAEIWIILALKIIGWTLLFVIPGIIMAVRYSLTSVVAFAEPTLGANNTSKKSAALTKNAWFDTFGALNLLNIVTLGLADLAIDISTKSKLYEQLKRLKSKGGTKPQTHPLSYLTLLTMILFAAAAMYLQAPSQI